MLSEKFQIIKKIILAETGINNDKLEESLKFVEKAQEGDYIYSEKLIDRYSLTEEESFRILALLSREKILSKVYRLYCPECNNLHPEKFFNLSELEEVEECPYCSNQYYFEKFPFKYLAILFKKS